MLGIDIGGTKTCFYRHGSVKIVPTSSFSSFADVLAFRKKNELTGISVAGKVSQNIDAPHIPWLSKVNVSSYKSQHVLFINDCDAFTYACATKTKGITLGICVGTGLGAGVVHKGQILYGAAELGRWSTSYNVVTTKVEELISGTALETIYSQTFHEHKSAQEIAKLIQAQPLLKTMGQHLGFLLVNAYHAYNPDEIILGGSLLQVDLITKTACAYLKKMTGFDTVSYRADQSLCAKGALLFARKRVAI
jgi:predicted NBD/HSP70 family sugar kinase